MSASSTTDLVRRRAEAQSGKVGGSGRIGRITATAAILGLTALMLAFIFAPQTLREIFRWGTSSSEKMQQTVSSDTGIQTDMTRQEEEESEPLEIAMPAPRPVKIRGLYT